jgi:hypothetical protein
VLDGPDGNPDAKMAYTLRLHATQDGWVDTWSMTVARCGESAGGSRRVPFYKPAELPLSAVPT